MHIVQARRQKGFDLISFKAFDKSLRAMGFSDRMLEFMNAIQSNFMCSVRTPAGKTGSFPVEKGCKHGCPFSPLRFNLVMEIFLRYQSEKKRGYSWKLNDSISTESVPRFVNMQDNVMKIPGAAFIDDLIFFANSLEEAKETIRDLEEFLAACGTTLNLKKCHFTSINVPISESHVACAGLKSRQMDDIGQHRRIAWTNLATPIKYIGHYFVAACVPRKEAFEKQRNHVTQVFYAALNRFSRLRVRPAHAIHILNSDVLSTLTYFLPFADFKSSRLAKMRTKLNSAIDVNSIFIRMLQTFRYIIHRLTSA